MRKRVVRELITVLGIAVILVVLVFANKEMNRYSDVDKYDNMRKMAENKGETSGVEILKWDLLRKTKGSFRSGPTFAEELKEKDSSLINVFGYIYPIEQFRDMTEFMLLPLPIQCYFCQQPPMRDIMLVTMAKGTTANMVEEPIHINGRLKLFSEPSSKFFYAVTDASWGLGQDIAKFTRKDIPTEHKLHQAAPTKEENLLDPYQIPKETPVDSPPAATPPSGS